MKHSSFRYRFGTGEKTYQSNSGEQRYRIGLETIGRIEHGGNHYQPSSSVAYVNGTE